MNRLCAALFALLFAACALPAYEQEPITGGGNGNGNGNGNGDGNGPGDNVTPEPPPEGTDPAAFFASSVQPLLGQCTVCHEAGGVGPTLFGQPGTADDYDSIVNDATLNGGFNPGVASLLSKGPHAGAAWWNQAQSTVISQWLGLENAARNGGGGGTPAGPTADELMAAFVGCMSKDNWDDTNMGDWAQKEAENNTCAACHGDAEWNFATNPNNDLMFEQQLTYIGSRSFFTIAVNDAGVASVVPAVDKIVAKCRAQNLHPECDDNDENFDNLQAFYSLTVQASAAGNCGPPGFSDRP